MSEPTRPKDREVLPFLSDGGEAGALMRSLDWSGSPLGDPSEWPQSLRSVVGLMLGSKFPMFVAWGPELGFLYNDAYAVILGAKHPRAMGSRFEDIWREIWSDINPLIQRALHGEATWIEDLPLVMNRKGFDEHTWFTFSYSPVRDDDGQIAGMFCAVAETTEKVLAERRLAGQAARWQRLFQRAPGFIVVLVGPEHRFEFVNEAYARLFGERDFVGRTAREAFPELEGQGFFEELDRVYSTGERFVAEAAPVLVDRTPGGSPEQRFLDFIYEPIVDEQGRVTGIFCEGHDVTARLAAESELRELAGTLEQRVEDALLERRLLLDIIDGTDIFVQVVDRDFNWLAINKAAAREFSRIFGVREPRTGDNMLAMLADQPKHQAAVKAVWSRALAGEEFVETDAFGDPALDRRYYEMRFRSLRDAEGKPFGAYQFVYDVTDRLREQEQLRNAEAALLQSRKMEAVGQLTGGIAHDFNNLLQGVAGSLDLIRRTPEDPARVRRWAEAGLHAAERGAKLTGQLLAFSRAQKIEVAPLVVADLVRSMRDLLQRTLGPSIRVVLNLTEEDAAVLSDPTQLEMAILNLAINARDAMPGEGTLTISTAVRHVTGNAELSDGDYVELSVADTGSGMSPEVIARAFDPFFTTKELGKGTGLGLSQVYGIARQGGGTAQIDSAPGRGTTVRILLKLTEAKLASRQTARTDSNAQVVPNGSVVVIDDDADVRRFLIDSFEALGYRVEAAPDGKGGLDAIERTDPQLLVVDFAMPGMNGADVAQAVRDRRPDLPIIFASGYADSEAIEAVLGKDKIVLRKPFRVDELQKAVQEALARA